MARSKDLTAGSPARLILLFALPLMAANVFEQLYTMVDTAVVGKGLGFRVLASLGASDWINWLVFSTVMGFTQGFSLQCAHDFGAGDIAKLRRTIAHDIRLPAVIGGTGLFIAEVAAWGGAAVFLAAFYYLRYRKLKIRFAG